MSDQQMVGIAARGRGPFANRTEVPIPLSSIPQHVLDKIEAGCRTGQWMIAVFSLDSDKLHLERIWSQFPEVAMNSAKVAFIDNMTKYEAKESDALLTDVRDQSAVQNGEASAVPVPFTDLPRES